MLPNQNGFSNETHNTVGVHSEYRCNATVRSHVKRKSSCGIESRYGGAQ